MTTTLLCVASAVVVVQLYGQVFLTILSSGANRDF
jgi:hypothetical protein